MKRRTIALVAVVVLWGASSGYTEDIAVEPPVDSNANDVLESALDRVSPGDRVVLRGGEFRLERPVDFPRGGERGRPVTLCAAPDEYVALLGSTRLVGWQRHQGKIWKVEHPPKHVKGLYEDSERLTHPRPHWGTREDPPLSELKAPGTWTQDAEWVYLWCREGDTPDNHRIEASQHHVMNVNQSWVHVEGLHMLFGQHLVCQITADHSEVVGCEIAHCSNSVDNSYNAYFSGCSNSAFRQCLIHDSFYWGDHGSNSHTLSTINCGDHGPNFVDGCEIFNGGLGVGSKGAVRELVVTGCYIYDQVNGVSITGERSSGPGAGKTDRGHYLVWCNRISNCRNGLRINAGTTHENRVWGNLIEHCDTGVTVRRIKALPDRLDFANNIFLENGVAVYLVAGRDGSEKISTFVQAGLRSRGNLFFDNTVDWRTPLTWSRNLDLGLSEVQRFKDLGLEQDSFSAKPDLDLSGYALADCPSLARGVALPLPDYINRPGAWHIGLGPSIDPVTQPKPSLALSIAGSAASVGPEAEVELHAALTNESIAKSIRLDGNHDAILTFHFRYRGGHRDKQELFRCRVELPEANLEPGEQLDLTTLPGWENPINGELGDPFHLRTDTDQWRKGCRLRATAQIVDRGEQTSSALQKLVDLIRSKEVLSVEIDYGNASVR
jgi:hypothetical protein